MPNRRGLSTLELVLALPILLGVMALMVNFGTAACWKVRALIVARQRLWEGRTERTGGANPVPAWWPGGVSTGGGHVESLDDPRVNLPVARGPFPAGAEVNSELLDPTRGLRTAASDLNRSFPMLRSMGTYHLSARSALLDNKWEFYRQMSAFYYGERRSPFLYSFAKAAPELGQAYVRAVMAIILAPFRKALEGRQGVFLLRVANNQGSFPCPVTTIMSTPFWKSASGSTIHAEARRLCLWVLDSAETPSVAHPNTRHFLCGSS